MIPKVIHYCWFGRGSMPELALKCIDSWKKWCPDYQIVEWNEDVFDINSNQYVKDAYYAKKYAFVSDYVRLYALYQYGGIYMDTDVMLLKSLDQYLYHEAFSGFENEEKIQTGVMASIRGQSLIGELLKYYDTAVFINEDQSLNLTTNVETITNIMLSKGLIPNGEFQTIGGFAFYPKKVFCPEHKKLSNAVYMSDAAAIHYFAGSWKSESEKRIQKSIFWRTVIKSASKISKKLEVLLGEKWVRMKKRILKVLFRG